MVTPCQCRLLQRIEKLQAEIENIKTLPYYTIFNREDERRADLAKASQKLERLRQLIHDKKSTNRILIN